MYLRYHSNQLCAIVDLKSRYYPCVEYGQYQTAVTMRSVSREIGIVFIYISDLYMQGLDPRGKTNIVEHVNELRFTKQ